MSLVSGLLNQNVSGIYSVSKDGYSDVTTTLKYSNVACRWQEKVEQVLNSGGELTDTKVQMWVEPNIVADIDYRVEKDSKTYVIIAVQKQYDLGGIHDHTKLFLV